MSKLAILLLLAIFPSPVWALNVTLTTKVEGEGKPVIMAKTNLPDGTKLLVTISRKESSYMGQDRTQVSNGGFRVGPFSQKGAPLNPGTYTLEVTSPLATLQPQSVQVAIGQDGNKLEGLLAKKSEFGGRVVEYKTTFQVGGGATSPKMDEATRQKTKKDTHEWWIQSCKDNCNITKGYAAKRGELFDWDQCYSKCLVDEPKKK